MNKTRKLIKKIASTIYNCFPTIWLFFCSTPEEIRWPGSEECTKLILERDVVIKENPSKVIQ